MSDITSATVFTTGQVAKICQVAPRTVSKWFDSGRLKGYRIPGSQDRRIPRAQLINFMQEHGMPLGDLLRNMGHQVLVVGTSAEVQVSLTEQLAQAGIHVTAVQSSFDAGISTSTLRPQCVVVDTALGLDEAITISDSLRELAGPSLLSLVALVSESDYQTGFDGQTFTETFKKPVDMVLLAERIRHLVSHELQTA